eukprot:2412764-Amphidinium_carterae.1
MSNTELKEKYFVTPFTYHAQSMQLRRPAATELPPLKSKFVPPKATGANALPLATHNKGKGKGKQIRSRATFASNSTTRTRPAMVPVAHLSAMFPGAPL